MNYGKTIIGLFCIAQVTHSMEFDHYRAVQQFMKQHEAKKATKKRSWYSYQKNKTIHKTGIKMCDIQRVLEKYKQGIKRKN